MLHWLHFSGFMSSRENWGSDGFVRLRVFVCVGEFSLLNVRSCSFPDFGIKQSHKSPDVLRPALCWPFGGLSGIFFPFHKDKRIPSFPFSLKHFRSVSEWISNTASWRHHDFLPLILACFDVKLRNGDLQDGLMQFSTARVLKKVWY